jgi:hypothetical protein
MGWVIIAFIAMLFFAWTPGTGYAQKAGGGSVKAPENVPVKVPEGTTMTKEQVTFPHQKHSARDCTVCHHKDNVTTAIGSCSKEGCHSNTAVKSGVDSFYAAFHAKAEKVTRSCVECHRQEKNAGNVSGPTTCNNCHIK